MAINLGTLSILGSSAPKSARPVSIGDILSFNARPDKPEDLIECTIKWWQNWKQHSARYMVFKATNVTAGDPGPCVSVFVQKSYYEDFPGLANDPVTFPITADWQYGQSDKTGADRFVVLHEQRNKPYQHRFVANLLVELDNLVHDALCAAGHSEIADKLENISETYFGEFLHSYNSVVTQSGDVLLVPSEMVANSFGSLNTVEWKHLFVEHERAQYYSFTVPNQTQKGQDIMFFIQKEWWDGDSTSENHISKIANKNKNGQYEFKIDEKSQYGQSERSGKDRWVVYHDKTRNPGQHAFITSKLHQTKTPIQTHVVAGIFGVPVESALEQLIKNIENVFSDPLHTFP